MLSLARDESGEDEKETREGAGASGWMHNWYGME